MSHQLLLKQVKPNLTHKKGYYTNRKAKRFTKTKNTSNNDNPNNSLDKSPTEITNPDRYVEFQNALNNKKSTIMESTKQQVDISTPTHSHPTTPNTPTNMTPAAAELWTTNNVDISKSSVIPIQKPKHIK